MKRFVLLGDPVGHSLSPAMHRAAFDAWGMEASYEARRVTGEELARAMREPAGGNVTLPHKPRAAALLEAPREDVRSTGACNCFWIDEAGRLAGDNTDVGGFAAALAEAGFEVEGARVLLLGAGGAARAAALALARGGARGVETLNRTVGRARELAADLGLEGLVVLEGRPRGAYDLVVNATRLGLAPGDPPPLDLETLEVRQVYDLVYGARGTAWTRRARELGLRAADGLGMLVHQAALSLARWFPERTPPLEALRAAAEDALTGRRPAPSDA